MSVADLEVEAARFARILSDVLNGSVCRDVELETVIIAPDRSRDRDRIAVGHRLSQQATPSPIPLSIAEAAAEREGAPTWLTLDDKLMLDEHRHHLSVHSSSVGLCIWPQTGRTVIRSEFDRDKNRYPAAHTHVAGTSLELGYAWGALGQRPPRGLEDLHFPLGWPPIPAVARGLHRVPDPGRARRGRPPRLAGTPRRESLSLRTHPVAGRRAP